MNYYITVLSKLLTVSPEYNSFLSAFLPMAMDSPALADALVAWSSGHLAATDGSYRVTALEARSTALQSLTESIACVSDNLTCCEANVATCLVLLTSEVCLGDHTGWYGHLKGIKNMIVSAWSSGGQGTHRGTDALRQSPEGQWILRNFAYHDVLGSVTLGTRPLIEGEYLQGITGLVDTYLGVASEILIFISEISCLDPLDLAHDSVEGSEDSRCASLERRIKSWKCQAGTAQTLVAVAYAYRSAALVYLYRRILRAEQCSPELATIIRSRIQIEVATTLEHVSDVPLNDNPETALLFPVFMAGGDATERNHIEMIRMRLVIMQGKRPFHNISRALQVLEEVWVQRRNHTDVDWKDVVDRQPGGLLLT
ncbi:hypothetical protein P170DRAFT_504950 [Aspergillus steynii IBT 23096]|uniref:Zn(II)2Cys6 transcription factor n=1 Tax=Aspergillus steynii IBT 23096 TaxID=1392250 RepID=A0A2I2GMP9_9EURO|nr:uncharacterized protein P170DRAFT_504950 [Aspergillus steynii IBT 23096]PLB54153.1 hypothetical protein P170DRAFT_504950 [Aspergillus steynii IBT 23096]